jgi:hypothetical protein
MVAAGLVKLGSKRKVMLIFVFVRQYAALYLFHFPCLAFVFVNLEACLLKACVSKQSRILSMSKESSRPLRLTMHVINRFT